MKKSATKAEMAGRIALLEAHLRVLLASHADFINAARRGEHPDIEWSAAIHNDAEAALCGWAKRLAGSEEGRS